jgi:hypothetical protein
MNSKMICSEDTIYKTVTQLQRKSPQTNNKAPSAQGTNPTSSQPNNNRSSGKKWNKNNGEITWRLKLLQF